MADGAPTSRNGVAAGSGAAMADDAAAGAARAGLATDSAPLHDGDGRQARPYDADGVRRAVRDLLRAVGEDPDRDGLVGTPERVARAYAEMFAGLAEDPADHLEAVFDIGHEEMVIVKDIPVYSVCEHHLLPFHGVAHVGYIPAADGRVTGLSKARPPGRGLRPPAPGPGAAHRPGRRRHRGPAGAARRARGGRGRAPVHVHARGAQARRADHHLRRPRPDAQRGHPRRGDEPHGARLTRG